MNEAYSVHVVSDQTSEGSDCYLAYHLKLQGCMSHGETITEALKNLEDARTLYLETMRELGQEIPPPSTVQTMAVWENFTAPGVASSAASPAHALPVTELTSSQWYSSRSEGRPQRLLD
ncbi:MAG: type II toxin-antitoxin system HicB family antitoxin [Nitrospira sp.]|nr:type II toxin-antitoxin system HicB family antitoxin [Nitrospira sp.]